MMNFLSDFPAGFSTCIAAALFVVLAGCGAVAQSDSSEPRAEIQINLCAPPQAIIQGLALHPDGAVPTEAWYFDTPRLQLAQRGLVFRLRQGDRQPELTLKVASQDCTRVESSWIPRGEGKCEYDNHGALFSGTVSLSKTLDDESAHALTEGRLPLERALGPAQIAYLRNVVSAWPLVSAIRPLGPIQIRQYSNKNAGYDVNVWKLSAGKTYVELSEKTSFKDVLQRRQALLAMLSRADIALCPDQAGQGIERLRTLLDQP
jgi:hypothetical protein